MKYTKQVLFAITLLFVGFKSQAQEITMFPGFWSVQYYQDDTRISKGQVQSLMQEHELSKMYWNKSKRHLTIGWLAFGVQIGSLIWQSNVASEGGNQGPPLAVGLGAAAVGVGFALSSASLKKKAILSYNKILSEKESYIHVGQTMNGLGLVCVF